MFVAGLFMLVVQLSQAAVYFSRNSGKWKQTNTWSTTGYGGAAALSTPGSAPGDVVLISGYKVTCDGTPANPILSVTISQNNATLFDTQLDILNTGPVTVLTVNSLAVTDNNRNTNIDITISASAILQVNGSVSFNRTITNNTLKREALTISGSGRMNVTGNFNFTYGRAIDNEPTANEIDLQNSGRLDVNGNMNITLGNNSGRANHFEFAMSSTSICNIGGALNATVSNTNDEDKIYFIMTGGTMKVTGACTNTVAATATNKNTIIYDLSGAASLATGAFTYNHLGKDETNTIEIKLSNTASLTVNGNFWSTYGHDGAGSPVFEIEMNNTAIFHITGKMTMNLTNCNDGDDLLLDFNGGTCTVDDSMTVNIYISGGGGGGGFKGDFMLLIDGGSMSTKNFTINHDGGKGDAIIKLNNGSTVSNSTLLVTGTLWIDHYSGDDSFLENNTNGTLTVTGQLFANLAVGANGANIYMTFNGGTSTFNSVQVTLGTGATNSNYLYFAENGGTVNVTNNLTCDQNGGGGKGDVDFWFNKTSTVKPSVLNVGGNFTINHTSGDNMYFETYANTTINVAGAFTVNLAASHDGDKIYMKFNGGTTTFNSATFTIATGAINSNYLYFSMDGGTLNITNDLICNQNGGGGKGDVDFWFNKTSILNNSVLNVGRDFLITHTAGDNVYFETYTKSFITVSRKFDVNLVSSADGDNIYMKFNGGTSTFNSATYTVGDGAVNGNYLYYYIDGGTVNVTNDLSFIQSGGGGKGDLNVFLNKNSTVTASLLNVDGNLIMTHTGGDNMELEMNNNVIVDVAGNFIDTLLSSDGDDNIIDINGGFMTVHGSYSYYHAANAGTEEDFNFRIDGSGRFDVQGSFTVDHLSGKEIVIYINENNGTTAQFNVGINMSITDGQGGRGTYLEFDQASIFNVEGDFTFNHNPSNDDIGQILIQNSVAFTVGGNLTLNNLSGLTTKNDNLILKQLGGSLYVGGKFRLNAVSGKDAYISIDGNSTTFTVIDTFTLNHSGGNLCYFYAGNEALNQSPTINLGSINLFDAGGGQTQFRLWNNTTCQVNGNVAITAQAATQVDLALYDNTIFRLRGSFIRQASPNKFGIISCANNSLVEYNSTNAVQTLSGNAGDGGDDLTFASIKLNNTSGLDPALVMNSSESCLTMTSVANLDFTRGIVATTAANYIIISDDGTVSNANNLSYVDGPIRKVGNDAFTFPVGDRGNYQAASISAPSNNTHHFTAQYILWTSHPTYDRYSKDATLEHISQAEYWIINRTNGNSNVKVTLSWDDKSGGVSNIPQLRIGRWDGSTWRDLGNGGTTGDTIAGTIITSGVVSSWAATSPFTLSSTTTNNPLPIDLISFDAISHEKKVSLVWSTASEKDNDNFTIERSQNGIDFTPLKMIKGAGNSNTLKNYGWDDESPLTGLSFYRLKQTDYNGAFTYSAIKSVHYYKLENISHFTIYPNPSNGAFINLKLKDTDLSGNSKDKVGVELYDMKGVRIYTLQKLEVEEGNGVNLKFVVPLMPGIYAVNIITEKYVEKQLLVIN